MTTENSATDILFWKKKSELENFRQTILILLTLKMKET